MNKKLLILISPFLLASTAAVPKVEMVPTIQLFSSVSLDSARSFLNRLPKEKKCLILKIKKYYAIRCITNNAKRDLKFFKKYAKDAFFINTKKEAIYPSSPKQNINTPNVLSQADYYFKKGDVQRSLELYKEAYKYDKNPQIATNISYLEGILGKNPSFLNEKDLYSYSIGAIKYGNKEKLKQIIKRNLHLSKRGYLDYVYGYLNENNPKIALVYYKNAYLKNPMNRYFIYGYARILDINKNYDLARRYYRKISHCNEKLCKIVKMRLRQLPK